MSFPGRVPNTRTRVTALTEMVLNEFRLTARAAGVAEAFRRNVVSRHDPSIRFTNSSISVLKPALGSAQRLFVAQPAVRLRNLDHYREYGRVSGYGCSFTAFGALLPADGLQEAIALAQEFLGTVLRGDGSLRMHGDPADADLLAAAEVAGWQVHEDPARPAAFRHRFGIPGVTGRNTNMAIDAGHGPVEVGNVIVVYSAGRPIGIDLAFGTPMLLVATSGARHPVLVSPAAQAAPHLGDLMLLDAIGTAAVLALDGMRPSARGRSGRYRQLLRVALERYPGTVGELAADLAAAVVTEGEIRRALSPLHPDDTERTVAAARDTVIDHLKAVASADTDG